MENPEPTSRTARLRARNVGGIDETTVELRPGLTVLKGPNATNRTSLLRATVAALGGDQVTLRGNEDDGEAVLEFDGERYRRTLERVDGGLELGGEPYLEDGEVADLFAFLLESNEVRRAVERGDDLRELVMRPIDTEAIREEIRRLQERKRTLDDRLSTIAERAEELPALEQRRAEVRSELEDKRDRLSELDPVPSGDTQETDEELEERLSELSERRSELSELRRRIASQEDSLASLREERREVRERLEETDPVDEGALDRIDRQLSELRGRKNSLESTVSRLDQIVGFNEDLLEGDSSVDGLLGGEGADATERGSAGDRTGDGAVTDRLLDDRSSVVCWTCGTEVQRSAIQGTLERLRDLRSETVDERRSVAERIDDLAAERKEIESRQSRRADLEERLERIRDEVDDRTDSIERARDRQGRLEAAVTDLEATVESLRDRVDEETVDRQREATRLELEIERLESELSDVESEIEAVEERLDERETLEADREDARRRIEELRTKVEDLESEVVERFNEHMANLLSALEYDNVERIWIERTETTVRDGRGTSTTRQFDLHVVRGTGEGRVYEDTVDHLSESEREVVGLVVALAGNLAHDVHERVPFILLDSLEAIDADRIATLLGYFEEYAEYLVVALLPEDAERVDPDHLLRRG